jgi:uncharacterized protein (DUF1800 family)
MNRVLLAAGLLTVSGIGSNPFDRKLSKQEKILHALDRLTFGPWPGDEQRVKSTGLDKWVEEQLHPERVPQNPKLSIKLEPLETLRMDTREMVRNYPLRQRAGERKAKPQGGRRALLEGSPEVRRQVLREQSPVVVIATDLIEGKLQRALLSNRQLEEVLVDFWFNHFNVYMNKGADRLLLTSYERDAIRPHVLGKFKELIKATARHPAMLFYLDNWQSVDPGAMERLTRFRRTKGPEGAPLRPRGLNENYARELLELHTLGVDGGYAQQDVIEVARCFTGWTIHQPRQGGGFVFHRALHDTREKTVLGHKIAAGGGIEDGERVIAIVTGHPSTARFISTKLAQRFVADQPPKSVVDRMSETFRKTDGDIRAVLRAMIGSKEFLSEGAYRAKLKSPIELVVSAVRALDGEVNTALVLSKQLDQLGQPL